MVPFEDSEELVSSSGLPPESLVEVGADHRLVDEESLKTMLRVVEGVETRTTKEHFPGRV